MRAPILAVILFMGLLGGAVQAMDIQQFDKMANDDQNEYVADLVLGAQKVLSAAGQGDKATRVRDLFIVIKPGDQISDGMADFEILLAKGRVADLRRQQSNPSARLRSRRCHGSYAEEERYRTAGQLLHREQQFPPQAAAETMRTTQMPRPILAAIVSAGFLLSGTVQAMEIREFDRMADQDQGSYIGDLIVGAEKVLTGEGKPALAARIKQLFTTKNSGDADTIGMIEFERNLALARVADVKRVQSDPKARRLEVEDAMFVTLKKNGIELPDSFFTVNNSFRPKLPPKQ